MSPPCPLHDADSRRLSTDAAAADAAGAPTLRQRALIHRRRWLTMLAPAAAGGGEWPLPRVVRLEEALAAADGSCGWLVTLCAGASWFAGFWPTPLAQRLLATPRVCIAGSGGAPGRALRDGGGWRLHGRWPHASGAELATHFTLLARTGDAAGSPVRAFVVPAAQVRIEPCWSTLGLRATGSHAFSVDGAWVPHEHAFTIAPEAAVAGGALWRFPFGAFAAVTLAANLSGMALGFLQAAGPLVARRPLRDDPLPGARAALADAREAFFGTLDTAWADAAAGRPIDGVRAAALEALSHRLATTAREAVDAVYPACGLQATDPRTPVNRAWRDLHTATQHAIWSPPPAP